MRRRADDHARIHAAFLRQRVQKRRLPAAADDRSESMPYLKQRSQLHCRSTFRFHDGITHAAKRQAMRLTSPPSFLTIKKKTVRSLPCPNLFYTPAGFAGTS